VFKIAKEVPSSLMSNKKHQSVEDFIDNYRVIKPKDNYNTTIKTRRT